MKKLRILLLAYMPMQAMATPLDKAHIAHSSHGHEQQQGHQHE